MRWNTDVAAAGQFTPSDAVEIALSAALIDAGVTLSAGRWDRLCRNCTSEIKRQLRKAGYVMDNDIQFAGGTFAETQTHLLRIVAQELRLLRATLEQNKTNGAKPTKEK
jgi:hypothetical protein